MMFCVHQPLLSHMGVSQIGDFVLDGKKKATWRVAFFLPPTLRNIHICKL